MAMSSSQFPVLSSERPGDFLEFEPGTENYSPTSQSTLGNHTFSHMDLHTNSVDAFEQEILADETTLKTYMGDGDWRWLRFPYLREGDTSEKYHAVRTFLKEHGYKVAEVTLSFADYAYNDPYARCLAKNDTKAIEWLKQSYINGATEDLSLGQEMARQILGRDIKHIMLLHIGGFETVMLPELLELLKQRGFKLITLPEAASDPAYAIEPGLQSNWAGTFLDQLRIAKHIPEPQHSKDPSAELDALCHRGSVRSVFIVLDGFLVVCNPKEEISSRDRVMAWQMGPAN